MVWYGMVRYGIVTMLPGMVWYCNHDCCYIDMIDTYLLIVTMSVINTMIHIYHYCCYIDTYLLIVTMTVNTLIHINHDCCYIDAYLLIVTMTVINTLIHILTITIKDMVHHPVSLLLCLCTLCTWLEPPTKIFSSGSVPVHATYQSCPERTSTKWRP